MIEVICNKYKFNDSVTGYVVKKFNRYFLISIQRFGARFKEYDRVEIYTITGWTKYLFWGTHYDVDFSESIYMDSPGTLGKALDYIDENL